MRNTFMQAIFIVLDITLDYDSMKITVMVNVTTAILFFMEI